MECPIDLPGSQGEEPHASASGEGEADGPGQRCLALAEHSDDLATAHYGAAAQYLRGIVSLRFDQECSAEPVPYTGRHRKGGGALVRESWRRVYMQRVRTARQPSDSIRASHRGHPAAGNPGRF
jgi:hypothetical protein